MITEANGCGGYTACSVTTAAAWREALHLRASHCSGNAPVDYPFQSVGG